MVRATVALLALMAMGMACQGVRSVHVMDNPEQLEQQLDMASEAMGEKAEGEESAGMDGAQIDTEVNKAEEFLNENESESESSDSAEGGATGSEKAKTLVKDQTGEPEEAAEGADKEKQIEVAQEMQKAARVAAKAAAKHKEEMKEFKERHEKAISKLGGMHKELNETMIATGFMDPPAPPTPAEAPVAPAPPANEGPVATESTGPTGTGASGMSAASGMSGATGMSGPTGPVPKATRKKKKPPTGPTWTEHQTPTGRVYFHDIMSKHSQWEDPTKGWVAKVDKESGKEYFQHNRTKERVWEKPIVLQSSSGVTMHPHRIWTKHVDSATGKKFYHNRHSGESKWTHPAEGWSAHLHKESGKPYYYNKETSTSHWSHPVVVGEKEHQSPVKNLQEVKKASATTSATGGALGATGAAKPKENAPPVDHHIDSLDIAMEEAAKHQKELRAKDIAEVKKASRVVYKAMIKAGLAARKRNRLRKIYDTEREEAVETMSESTFAAHHANHEHHANASDLVVLKSLELSQDASKRALNETKDLIKAREKWSEAAKEAAKDKQFAVAAKKSLVKLSQAQLQRMHGLVNAINTKVLSVKGNLTQRLHIAQNDSVHVKQLFSDKSMDPAAIETAMHAADSSAHVAILTKRYYQALKARKKVALESLDTMMGKEDPPEEDSTDYSTPILDKLQADVESAVAASNKARARAAELVDTSRQEAGSESEAQSGAESESK